jgi:hypothetical protein
MIVPLKVKKMPAAARIEHSVTAYDRATEELDLDLPIPWFLDTLALKIGAVPPEDQYGALSWPLGPGAVDIFRFLLGLEVDMAKRAYFLEPTAGFASSFGAGKLEAVDVLTRVTPRPRYAREGEPGISERELVFPVLRLLDDGETGWMGGGEIAVRLAGLFAPLGWGGASAGGRGDAWFSRKVRAMVSHRDQPLCFIRQGLALCEREGLRISDQGRSAVRALLSCVAANSIRNGRQVRWGIGA